MKIHQYLQIEFILTINLFSLSIFSLLFPCVCVCVSHAICLTLILSRLLFCKYQWRSLDMSGVERRRLFCAVLFHFAAALCVIWSLCVLIERAAEEVKRGLIGWPFWTKLVVVTGLDIKT